MRYLGNKVKLTDFIFDNIKDLEVSENKKFFDLFSGTASVGKFLKEKGYEVESSDILYCSYVLQKAYIENTGYPKFTFFKKKPKDNGYLLALEYLNSLKPVKGYVYNNFTEEGTKNLTQPRKFFSVANGKKIDSIRQSIESLYIAKRISENEYFVLLATLLENVSLYANVSGVYAAFLKKYDPRALKDFKLRPIELNSHGANGKSYHSDAEELIENINTDILYLDPPYNSRQYAPNYHVLETIARYDNPVAKGVAGIREYSDLKSDFCNHDKALILLDKIAGNAEYKILVMSYNSEGLLHSDEIKKVLNKYGTVMLVEKEYRRYKSNKNGNSTGKAQILEQLYILIR
jgi:adenine-specific DNA-methyltransferase